MSESIKVLDLFSGAGGLSEGFKQASSRFRTLRAVESDLAASATYEANHGTGLVYTGEIQSWLLEEETKNSDLVIGGPPCQGFSNLGKRDVDDERNLLWYYYAQTLLRSNPQYFVLENVSNFQKSPQFKLFEEMTSVEGQLSDYAFECVVLNAANFGTPQLRKRAIVIGWHRDLKKPSIDSLTSSGLQVENYKTFDDAVKGIPELVCETDLPKNWIEFNGKNLPGVFSTSQLHLTRNYTDLSLERFKEIGPGQNRFAIPDYLLPNCWKDHTTGSFDVMGRVVPNRPSVTIRTEFFKPEKGRYLHPTQNRAITHLEAARLQGFSDDYLWVGSKTSIARQIGNAVPIPLAKAIAEVVLAGF